MKYPRISVSRGWRLPVVVIGATATLGLVMLLCMAAGEIHMSASSIAHILGRHLLGNDMDVDPIDDGIVWNYRLPRTIVAACCGAGLSLSGAVLQTLLRNALADPYLVGISAGASTGAVLVTIAGVGAGAISIGAGAFAGAVTAFALVALLAQAAGSGGLRNHAQIILAGIAGSQLFNALTSLIITKSGNAEQARGILFWLLGSLSGVRWPDVPVSVLVITCGVVICLWRARALDAFTFGAESAASLGISVRRVQAELLLCAALMTAMIVSVVGAIGFVGLVIPHVARLLTGGRHGRLLPACALMGAIFLMLADICARILLKGQVLPIGVVTALVGAPVFAAILLSRRKQP
ncbi:MAG: iron ABC transporter permease [Lautropia sp.]|nr:iron ABC transporter permease [Lautropia sp.]